MGLVASPSSSEIGSEVKVCAAGSDAGGGDCLSPGSGVFEGPHGSSSGDIWFRTERERERYWVLDCEGGSLRARGDVIGRMWEAEFGVEVERLEVVGVVGLMLLALVPVRLCDPVLWM